MAFERVGIRLVVEGMGQFQRAMQQVEKGFKKAGDASREASKDTKDFDRALTGVGVALTAAAAAGGAFLFSATKLAARVETLGVVTRRLGQNVGMTAEEIGELEQGIKDQGITLQASRKSIALMIQSQIDLAKGTELARLAQDAAVIANVDSSEAFQRLVFVITSGNVRMARTLGLQVSFQDAYKKMAQEVGKATTELTQQEKVQARTNAVLAAGATIGGAYEEAMTTAGKKLLSLNRHVEESRRIMGEAWLPAFGAAVDLITDLLKGFQDMDESQQRMISTFGGSLVVITGFTGAVLTLIPKLKGAVAGIRAMDAATKAAAISTAIYAAAVAAVALAVVQLIAFAKDVKDKQEEVVDAQEDMVDSLLRGEGGYEKYREEVERVNQVIEDNGILGELVADKLDLMTEAEFDAARGAAELADAAAESDRRMIAAAESAAFLKTEEGKAAQEAARLAREEEKAAEAAEEFEKAQEAAGKALEELTMKMDIGFGDSVEDFQENIEDLETDLADLESERIEAIAEIETEGLEDVEDAEKSIERLNDQRSDAIEKIGDLEGKLKLAKLRQSEMNDETKESTRLAAQQRIDTITAQIEDQRERVGELTGTIKEWEEGTLTNEEKQIAAIASINAEYAEKAAEIRENIDEVKEAFSEQTARLIFDLAQQRLAIDGFTQEELDFLRQLAGPEGLGLIDQTGVALLDQIDDIASGLELPGSQVEQAVDDVARFFDAIKEHAEEGEEAVIDALEEIPSVVDIEFKFRTTGEIPDFSTLAGLNQADFQRLLDFGLMDASVVLARQRGGPLRKGQVGLIGERGPELFFPKTSGTVMPNQFVKGLASMLRAALPVVSGAGAGVGATVNDQSQMNLSIHSAAPQENIIQDFEMMRALSGRRQ